MWVMGCRKLFGEKWTHLFNYIEDGPGQVVATLTQAGSFEPAAGVGVGQAVGHLLDAQTEDWLDGTDIE